MSSPAPVEGEMRRLPAVIAVETWAFIHVSAAWVVVAGAAFALFWHGAWGDLLPAGVHALLAAVALAAGYFSRHSMRDVISQMGYREKFLLFICHMGAMMVPVVIGVREAGHSISILLLLLSLQTFSAVGFGRIYAVAIVVVLERASSIEPLPLFFAPVWMLALLVAFRAEFVRFRLEQHGLGEGTLARSALRETMRAVFGPWFAGVAVLLGAWFLLGAARRGLVFTGDVGTLALPAGPVTMPSLIWDAVVLVALITGSLFLLAWIEQFLRRRSPGASQLEEEIAAAGESRAMRETAALSEPDFLESQDARGQVVRRFRLLAERFGEIGLGRRKDETAVEYVDRLTQSFPGGVRFFNATRTVFNAACYSRNRVTDDDFREFGRAADQAELEWKRATEAARGGADDDA
ncbi:DUF4129 domain-containing protein [Candidatus Poribacteria bacterium]|nr:DUF4129 domain-containing protein [Candidatus Poribacteria bacterium]